MPTTRKSKVVKTAEFIESDSDDSNGSGDYQDKDKYVSTYLNIYLGFMLNKFIQKYQRVWSFWRGGSRRVYIFIGSCTFMNHVYRSPEPTPSKKKLKATPAKAER